MKKILILAIGAFQLLPLPQINAVNGYGEIAVPENYEVKNGLLGFDRDTFIFLGGTVARGSTFANAQKNVKKLFGINKRTLKHWDHLLFKTTVPGEVENRKELGKRVLQQPVAAIKISNGAKRTWASNDAGTLVGEGLAYSTDGGKHWNNIDICARKVKYMDGKFFAFGAERMIENEKWGFVMKSDFGRSMADIYVSNDGIEWAPFFELTKENEKAFGPSIFHNVMAYGNDKYIMVTGNGKVLTKGKDNGSKWEENSDLSGFFNSERLQGAEMPFFYPSGKNNPNVKEIVYGGENFVLKFPLGNKETYFCAGTNGVSWEVVQEDKLAKNLVGGPLGFAYLGEGNRLYYSPSGKGWDKVKLPGMAGGVSESFRQVMYIDSSFYGDMFIALPYNMASYVLVGTKDQQGIAWSWVRLNISFSEKPVRNQDIEYIYCIGKKIIIEGCRDLSDEKFRAQLQFSVNRR
ncbi:MAG: hypothetical protein LBT70_00115 [Holosporaceae bacterium]|nr:hypothetical protein [Holosporaceae bacterium]